MFTFSLCFPREFCFAADSSISLCLRFQATDFHAFVLIFAFESWHCLYYCSNVESIYSYRKGRLLISRSLTEPVVGRLRPRLHLFSINTGLIQCSLARCAWQNHPFNFFFFVFVSKNSALTIYSKQNDKIEWIVSISLDTY